VHPPYVVVALRIDGTEPFTPFDEVGEINTVVGIEIAGYQVEEEFQVRVAAGADAVAVGAVGGGAAGAAAADAGTAVGAGADLASADVAARI